MTEREFPLREEGLTWSTDELMKTADLPQSTSSSSGMTFSPVSSKVLLDFLFRSTTPILADDGLAPVRLGRQVAKAGVIPGQQMDQVPSSLCCESRIHWPRVSFKDLRDAVLQILNALRSRQLEKVELWIDRGILLLVLREMLHDRASPA